MDKFSSVIKRETCVVCEGKNLRVELILEGFPIYMGTTNQSIEHDYCADQIWAICSDCGCIQLAELIPLEVLYSENHHSEPVGNLWQTHHKKFAEFILRRKVVNIVEIGGAHCYLAEILLSKVPDITYTVIEPAPTKIPSSVTVIQDFAENQPEILSTANPLVHSHVIEHLYDPGTLIKLLAQIHGEGQITHLSMPNIPALISSFGSNSLNFEHTYFLDVEVFSFMITTCGFEIIDIEYYESHSIFLSLRKTGLNNKIPTLNKHIESSHFIAMHEKLRSFALNTSLRIKNTDSEVFLFGAHIFSQTLLFYGIEESCVTAVLDNSPQKIGGRLYGSSLSVKHPSAIQNLQSPIVVLVATHYQREIKNQLLALNESVTFLEL